MRYNLIAVVGLTLHVNRCSLARATGPVFLKSKPETEEPAVPVTTDFTDLIAKPETEEPIASITTGITDLIAKPETEESVALMNTGALPRRCRPFSLTESGPLKSRTKHNNGVRVLFSPSAHERQCEALGLMDRPFQVLMTQLERRLSRLDGESSDLLQSRKLEALATPSLFRSLSKNYSEAADAPPPHRCRWALIARKQVLSRESHGACFSHGSFCLVKKNGRLREVRGGTINFLGPLNETQ